VFCLCDSPRSPASRRRRRFRHHWLAARRCLTRRLSDSPPSSRRHLHHAFDEDLAAAPDVDDSSTAAETFAGDPLSLDLRSTTPGVHGRSTATLATSTINSGLLSCGALSSTIQPTSSAIPAFNLCSGSAVKRSFSWSVRRGFRGRRYLGSIRNEPDRRSVHRRQYGP